MKQSLLNALRGFVCGLASCALGALLIALTLALYDIPRTVVLAAAPWVLLLLSLSLACELITARNGNLLIFVAACAAFLFWGGEYVIRHTQFIPGSSGFPVFLRILIWLSGFACAYAVHKLPTSDLFVRLSDAIIVSVVFYLGMAFFVGDAPIMPVLMLALCALAACLLTAAALRAGGESNHVVCGVGAGGVIILVLPLLGCVLLMGLLSSLFGGQIHGIVDLLLSIWNFVLGILKRILDVFVYLLAFIVPKPVHYDMAPVQSDAFMMGANGVEVSAQMPRWLIYLFIGLIALLILAAVLAILWMLRNTKLSRTKRRTPRRVIRQSRMLEAILVRIRAIQTALAFEAAYKRNRRTPQGLYILALRTCRLTRLKKRPSESPSVFICRLHAYLLDQSGLSTLDALADKLDRALYAREQVPLSHGESDAFAAQIAALSKCIRAIKNPVSR